MKLFVASNNVLFKNRQLFNVDITYSPVLLCRYHNRHIGNFNIAMSTFTLFTSKTFAFFGEFSGNKKQKYSC